MLRMQDDLHMIECWGIYDRNDGTWKCAHEQPIGSWWARDPIGGRESFSSELAAVEYLKNEGYHLGIGPRRFWRRKRVAAPVWHPASTPPDTDRRVLAFWGVRGQTVCRYVDNGWISDVGLARWVGVTHWMELPAAPVSP